MGYGAVDTYHLVRLRQYCNGARSCMVSKNTEKGSISRNSLSPQPKMAHSGKRDMSGFPIYSPSSSAVPAVGIDVDIDDGIDVGIAVGIDVGLDDGIDVG